MTQKIIEIQSGFLCIKITIQKCYNVNAKHFMQMEIINLRLETKTVGFHYKLSIVFLSTFILESSDHELNFSPM